MYVDDLLIKSKEPKRHTTDLREAFRVLRIYKMKLNPAKCTFAIELGKFLNFMV